MPAPDGLPCAATDEGRSQLEANLRDRFNNVVNPSFADGRKILLRISAQIYNLQ
jgi:hypothetical protein